MSLDATIQNGHFVMNNIQPTAADYKPLLIILQHVYGVSPVELRLQRLAERLHALGPRPVFEFCRELAEAYGINADVQRRLERYAGLDPAFILVLGADYSPPPPLHGVEL